MLWTCEELLSSLQYPLPPMGLRRGFIANINSICLKGVDFSLMLLSFCLCSRYYEKVEHLNDDLVFQLYFLLWQGQISCQLVFLNWLYACQKRAIILRLNITHALHCQPLCRSTCESPFENNLKCATMTCCIEGIYLLHWISIKAFQLENLSVELIHMDAANILKQVAQMRRLGIT